MAKQNCWEFKKCGRNLGSEKVKELGVCPASVETRTDGVNNGSNGGRACWAITKHSVEVRYRGPMQQKWVTV